MLSHICSSYFFASRYFFLFFDILSLHRNNTDRNKVLTAKTKVSWIFVSWVVKTNETGPCCMHHIEDAYPLLYEELDACNISDMFEVRRGGNDETLNQKPLRFQERSKWPLSQVFVTITQEKSDAKTIGKNLASNLVQLDTKARADCNPKYYRGPYGNHIPDPKAGFTFGGIVSHDDNLLPLSYYLSDRDTLSLLHKIFGDKYTKEVMMSDFNHIIEGFFGDARRGRELINGSDWRSTRCPNCLR